MTIYFIKPVESDLDTIWEALHSHRDTCIAEGVAEHDAQWETICEAMARLTEALNIDEVTR
jgi:hypothetical protein